MSSKVEQAEQLLEGTGYALEDLVFCYRPKADESDLAHATYYCSRTNSQVFEIWPANEHPLLDLIDFNTLPDDPPEAGRGGWVRLTFKSVLEETEHTVVEVPERDD